MDRPALKKTYHIVIAVAFGLGFALGYTLRNPTVGGGAAASGARDLEREFPGCRRTYLQLRELFAKGEPVRTDYDLLLKRVDDALAAHPDYAPFAFLKSMIREDQEWNLVCGRYDAAQVSLLAASVGAPEQASTATLAEVLRARALQACLEVQRSPLIAQPEKYGGRWQAIWQQHVNAHRRTQVIRIAVEDTGQADLTPAYNAYALTRDFVRYPNNLSPAREGYSFPEKRIADRIECPQHPAVVFHFPCLPCLSPDGGPSNRSDLEWFRTGLRLAGQKLDIEPRLARAVHLLAFNTTPERRIVKAQARILFADGRESVFPFEVPPWRQDEKMAADPLERRRLDPVLRDTEIHTANGTSLHFPWAPFYMYHVALPLDPPGQVDEIYFPAPDPTTAGLHDAGISDVCIAALTLEE